MVVAVANFELLVGRIELVGGRHQQPNVRAFRSREDDGVEFGHCHLGCNTNRLVDEGIWVGDEVPLRWLIVRMVDQDVALRVFFVVSYSIKASIGEDSVELRENMKMTDVDEVLDKVEEVDLVERECMDFHSLDLVGELTMEHGHIHLGDAMLLEFLVDEFFELFLGLNELIGDVEDVFVVVREVLDVKGFEVLQIYFVLSGVIELDEDGRLKPIMDGCAFQDSEFDMELMTIVEDRNTQVDGDLGFDFGEIEELVEEISVDEKDIDAYVLVAEDMLFEVVGDVRRRGVGVAEVDVRDSDVLHEESLGKSIIIPSKLGVNRHSSLSDHLRGQIERDDFLGLDVVAETIGFTTGIVGNGEVVTRGKSVVIRRVVVKTNG